jgi:hypothetical protein
MYILPAWNARPTNKTKTNSMAFRTQVNYLTLNIKYWEDCGDE